MTIMWTVAFNRILGLLHGTPVPHFNPICHSFGVFLVQDRLTEPVTAFAALVVYPRIVFIARVHSYGDDNLFAGPSSGFTGGIVASSVAVDFMEVEREKFVVQ
ncbi:hypothetical protein BDV24DRAFT_148590 [Aspergillus arachidicola]|uniref:Uncharacterized protein n=1 Tax=Aspergillus arachidicola TaxID=656916 RepID=A0A5N6YIJ0_9EURO|nr:hypothetical protein BDV24DRAFT_148590 [Aspergillus arachidicola]